MKFKFKSLFNLYSNHKPIPKAIICIVICRSKFKVQAFIKLKRNEKIQRPPKDLYREAVYKIS